MSARTKLDLRLLLRLFGDVPVMTGELCTMFTSLRRRLRSSSSIPRLANVSSAALSALRVLSRSGDFLEFVETIEEREHAHDHWESFRCSEPAAGSELHLLVGMESIERGTPAAETALVPRIECLHCVRAVCHRHDLLGSARRLEDRRALCVSSLRVTGVLEDREDWFELRSSEELHTRSGVPSRIF